MIILGKQQGCSAAASRGLGTATTIAKPTAAAREVYCFTTIKNVKFYLLSKRKIKKLLNKKPCKFVICTR